MQKVKIALIYLSISTGLTTAFVARASEKNRTTSTTAYFQSCSDTNTWYSVTLQYQYFDNIAVEYQAALRDDWNNDILLYSSQSTSTPVKFNCP